MALIAEHVAGDVKVSKFRYCRPPTCFIPKDGLLQCTSLVSIYKSARNSSQSKFAQQLISGKQFDKGVSTATREYALRSYSKTDSSTSNIYAITVTYIFNFM